MAQVSSLDQALVRWAEAQPRAPFLTEPETGVTISYGDALRAVRGLQQMLGPTPRTVVLALPGGIPASILWIASLAGGHRLVLCSADAADYEKQRLAQRYQPDVIAVARQGEALAFGQARPLVLTMTELERARQQASQDHSVLSDGDGLGHEGEVCLTTSGTTGEPKGVTLRGSQVAWAADQVRLSHRLTARDRGLTTLPFFHVNAPVVSLSATLMAGASLVIAPRFSRSHFWEWIGREGVTWASVVPAIVAVLLQTERPSWLPSRLRFVRTASAPLPAFHMEAFERRFGIPLIETYGLSEAASQVAANPVPPGRHKAGSVGLPTGVDIQICEPADPGAEPALRRVRPGEEGEICVAGPSVITGYDGGASPESFFYGWFRTGDMGYQDPDGYIHITGRMRDVINRGGEKIAPREVEEVLLTHPDVREVVVVGEPDPIYGQHPVAYVVPREPELHDLQSSLREHSSQRLSRYKVPVEFVQVDELPRTRTGKLQRHLLVREHPAVEVAGAGAAR